MKKRVCIIGAGVGGLIAGASLAMEGYKVTVIEKASTVGGSAGWYMRKGRMFPTGATIAFGLEENGVLSNLLDDLQIHLQIEDLLHPMDVILDSTKVSIYKDPTLWEQELRTAFKDRSDDVLKFWNELQNLGEDILAITENKVSLPIKKLYDLGTLPKYAIRSPKSLLRPARYALWTVEDLLRKYNLATYEPLKQFLNAQLLDAVQTDVSQAALLPSSVALTIYRNGSFHIKNGIGQLSNALARRIEELGGNLILSSPVNQLDYDDNDKVWQIKSRKVNASFDVIINNSGTSLEPGSSYDHPLEFTWGAFRIDAILSDQIMQKQLLGRKLPFAFQIVPNIHFSQQNIFHGPIYVTFHQTIDKDGKVVDGEITMTVTVHTNIDPWLSYTRDEYKERKGQLSKDLLSEVERIIPIKESLIFAEAGTPLTYKKFIGKAGVGGFPLTVSNAILKPKSVRSTLPQLYIVGEQVFPGPGTLSACLSGYYAARAIMKDC